MLVQCGWMLNGAELFSGVSFCRPEAVQELGGVESRWLDMLAEAEKQEFD